jgi:hypothetical protein
MWTRYKQRINGGFVSAGYTWLPLVTQLRVTSAALIVGCGNGGLADLLIECFNIDCIGLDLEKDMPRDSATLLNYVPVGIQFNHRTKFLQSDWSINSSGDWLDSSVRSRVFDTLPALATLFIDVTGPDVSEVTTALILSMASSMIANAYCRLIGSEQDLNAAMRELSLRHSVRMWVISRSLTSMEVVVECSRSDLPIHRCLHAPSMIEIELPELMHKVIPRREGELLEAATFNTFSWDGETLFEACTTMRNLCISLLNKPKHQQLNYSRRYGLMIGYSTLIAVTSDNPVFTIQEWISDERIETDLFTYELNDRTTTHLLKYAARLSRYTDNSLLFFS